MGGGSLSNTIYPLWCAGLLGLEFEAALEVHSGQLVRSRQDFRLDIEANWAWLDGRSLLV